MIHLSVEQGEDRASEWLRTASDRESRWMGVARELGEGPPQEAEHDYGALLYSTIPDEYKRAVAASDPVRDDPFTDIILKNYENCVIHPPAPAAKLQAFERAIRCAGFARFYANIEQGRSPPSDLRLVLEAQNLADKWDEAGSYVLIVPINEAFSAEVEAVERHRSIYDGLSLSAKETYMHQIRTGLQQCMADPPG